MFRRSNRWNFATPHRSKLKIPGPRASAKVLSEIKNETTRITVKRHCWMISNEPYHFENYSHRWFIPISGGRVVQVATVERACKRSMVCCTLRHYWTVCGNQPTTCHDFSGCSPYLWHTGCKRVTDIETRRGPQPFLPEISCSHPLYYFASE